MILTASVAARRLALLWLALTPLLLGTAALAPAAATSLRGLGSSSGPDTFDRALTDVATLAAALAAGVLWLGATRLLVAALHGRLDPARRRGVSRLLLGACGLAVLGAGTGLGLGIAPAHADDGVAVPSGPGVAVLDPHRLEGLPLPDRAVDPTSGPATPSPSPSPSLAPAAPTPPAPSAVPTAADDSPPPPPTRTRAPRRPPAPAHGSVTVRPGDSLWTIAEQAVAAAGEAPPGAVGRYWVRLMRLNAAALGPDPGLIHPGQVLRLPVPHQPDQPDQEDR